MNIEKGDKEINLKEETEVSIKNTLKKKRQGLTEQRQEVEDELYKIQDKIFYRKYSPRKPFWKMSKKKLEDKLDQINFEIENTHLSSDEVNAYLRDQQKNKLSREETGKYLEEEKIPSIDEKKIEKLKPKIEAKFEEHNEKASEDFRNITKEISESLEEEKIPSPQPKFEEYMGEVEENIAPEKTYKPLKVHAPQTITPLAESKIATEEKKTPDLFVAPKKQNGSGITAIDKYSKEATEGKLKRKVRAAVLSLAALAFGSIGGNAAYNKIRDMFQPASHPDLESSAQNSPQELLKIEIPKTEEREKVKFTESDIVQTGEGFENVLIRKIVADPKSHGFDGNLNDKESIRKFAESEAHKIALKENIAQKIAHPGDVLSFEPGKITITRNTNPELVKNTENNNNDSEKIKPKEAKTKRSIKKVETASKESTQKEEVFDTKNVADIEKTLAGLQNGMIVSYQGKEYELGLPLTENYGKGNYRLLNLDGKVSRSGMRISKNISAKKIIELISNKELKIVTKEEPKKTAELEINTHTETRIEPKNPLKDITDQEIDTLLNNLPKETKKPKEVRKDRIEEAREKLNKSYEEPIKKPTPTPEPIKNNTPKEKPIEKENVTVNNNARFKNIVDQVLANDLELRNKITPAQIAEAKAVFDTFDNGVTKGNSWRTLGSMSADFIDGNINPAISSRYREFLVRLMSLSGLKPKTGDIYKHQETVEEYMIRALSKLAAEGNLNKLK